MPSTPELSAPSTRSLARFLRECRLLPPPPLMLKSGNGFLSWQAKDLEFAAARREARADAVVILSKGALSGSSGPRVGSTLARMLTMDMNT